MSLRVYLSPHLDDAVLSCGGEIFKRSQSGEDVVVLTLFTADVPSGPLPPLAAKVLEAMALPREEATARRRDEDQRACRAVGARAVHWNLAEATLRLDADGAPLYDSFGELFGHPRDHDDAVVETVATCLVDYLEALPTKVEVVAPLAVGSHVDHHVVRRAAECVLGDQLTYYEDYPYVARFMTLERVIGWPFSQRRRGWRPHIVPVGPAALEAKVAAIGEYKSQIAPLFASESRMARRVRRRAFLVGGERLWSRVSPRA